MFNETLTQVGTEVFRAQTGGAYRIKGAYGLIVKGTAFPAKGSIPVGTGISGTIKSTGTLVRGTGTLFLSQIFPGDFLYQKEVVRRVVSVSADDMLEVADAFPTDISVAVIPIRVQSQLYKSIYAKSVHASAAATIQEAPFSAGNTHFTDGLPISFDATSGTIEFTVTT